MKRVLIIGDGSSVFVLNHAKNIITHANDIVLDILLTNSFLKPDYSAYFSEVHFSYKNSFLTKIPLLKGPIIRIIICLYLLRFKKKYDILHVQFLNDNIIYFNIFSRIAPKIIFSIWGSDFYRAKGVNLFFKKRVLKNADIVTFANEQTKDDFSKKISSKAEYKICRFGLLPLDYLQNINSTKLESRNYLGLPKNKIIITIGYNLNPNQQHLMILQEIIKLKNSDYFKDIFLILPITYPNDKSRYKTTLIKFLELSELPYKIYETFLPETDNAHLRNCSDIMIQLQTSDQLSGAMQEYLYSENIVITGSWLPYKVLFDKGIKMISVNSISELSGVLNKTIENLDVIRNSVSENKNIILEFSSWDKNIRSWIEIYN
ncbi:MAG: glycosyltransferase [Deltaproteobacteria bacterium]